MKALISSICLLLVSVSTLMAQSRQTVISQIEFATSIFTEDGFFVDRTPAGSDMTIGLLNHESRAYLEIRLEEGRDYVISGACDEDCSDLDLQLLSSSGDLINQDIDLDDVPILSFSPTSTGSYLLGIIMADCDTEICYFGYRIFKRGDKI